VKCQSKEEVHKNFETFELEKHDDHTKVFTSLLETN